MRLDDAFMRIYNKFVNFVNEIKNGTIIAEMHKI